MYAPQQKSLGCIDIVRDGDWQFILSYKVYNLHMSKCVHVHVRTVYIVQMMIFSLLKDRTVYMYGR